MNLTAKRAKVRMSLGRVTVCHCSGCPCYLYDSSLHTWFVSFSFFFVVGGGGRRMVSNANNTTLFKAGIGGGGQGLVNTARSICVLKVSKSIE